MASTSRRSSKSSAASTPKDPGTWPRAAEDRCCCSRSWSAFRSPAYFIDWQGQLEELEAGRAQEVKLKQEYVDKKRQAVNLDLLRASSCARSRPQFGALLKQLPNKSQMDALLVDINQAGLGRGLQFELFKPARRRDPARVLRRAADLGQA